MTTRFASIAEPPSARARWALAAGLLLGSLVLALALGGCAGTQMTMSGQICGQTVDMSLVDRKDRSGFEGSIDCPGGGGVHVASTESSTSAVLAAQAQLLQTLAGLVAQLAHAAPVPPVAWTPPLAMTARGLALERLAYTVEAEGHL